jgi:hypothetical protein
MMAALMAHIAEHAAFAYRAQVEMSLGVPLPTLDEEDNAPIAPEDEKALAPLIAAAAQRFPGCSAGTNQEKSDGADHPFESAS